MINKKTPGVSVALILAMAAFVRADAVLIIGDGDVPNTETAKAVLLADGHTSVTIDTDTLDNFDGTGLSGYNAVVLLDDNGGDGYNIPTAGQDALVNFVSNGGGLVTSEWINWNASFGTNPDLEPILPMKPNSDYSYASPITYSQSTADATLDAGLPSSFTFDADEDGGTEDLYQQKPTAIEFFSSDDLAASGLIGWDYSSGRVIGFSTLIAGEDYDASNDPEMNDPNYSRLFSNSVFWAEQLSPPAAPLPASVYGGAGLIGMLLLSRLFRNRSAVE